MQNLGYNLITMVKFLLTMLFAAFFVSCDLFLDLMDIDTLEPDEFYALNFQNDSFYKVKAKIMAEGKKCVIWAANDSGVTKGKAEEIAAKYDNEIRPKIVDAFGRKNISYAGGNFVDILDYANWLAGKNNRKLTILLLDIKDDFTNKKPDSYVAGYFFSGNFFTRGQRHSNGCDMIYVDTNPGLDPQYKPNGMEKQTYATFAHELQHLINYATSTLMKNRRVMDTWIDEGLSSQAEYIYLGENLVTRCAHFSEDKLGTIAKGNNFFVWGNHSEEPLAILDDYATVYMFFRWLYLQANRTLKSRLFLDIETSDYSDHSIITNVAKEINPGWANWDALLGSWLAANYYPSTSVYGYNDDSYLKGIIKVKPIKTANDKILLYPGEGVYSIIKEPFTKPANGTNIRYIQLSNGASDILLTYNANTNNNKSTATETGYLTGVSPSVSPINSRMVIGEAQTETYSGPYVIDARDVSGILGRDR
jgi:hypothetical protein